MIYSQPALTVIRLELDPRLTEIQPPSVFDELWKATLSSLSNDFHGIKDKFPAAVGKPFMMFWGTSESDKNIYFVLIFWPSVAARDEFRDSALGMYMMVPCFKEVPSFKPAPKGLWEFWFGDVDADEVEEVERLAETLTAHIGIVKKRSSLNSQENPTFRAHQRPLIVERASRQTTQQVFIRVQLSRTVANSEDEPLEDPGWEIHKVALRLLFSERAPGHVGPMAILSTTPTASLFHAKWPQYGKSQSPPGYVCPKSTDFHPMKMKETKDHHFNHKLKIHSDFLLGSEDTVLYPGLLGPEKPGSQGPCKIDTFLVEYTDSSLSSLPATTLLQEKLSEIMERATGINQVQWGQTTHDSSPLKYMIMIVWSDFDNAVTQTVCDMILEGENVKAELISWKIRSNEALDYDGKLVELIRFRIPAPQPNMNSQVSQELVDRSRQSAVRNRRLFQYLLDWFRE
ncbi:hypothetical protein PG997_011207 [Apiospora hydei]|uniref:Uncharacterized protein n=1 Tax=Apiospora hydei TaxID=1337664 RepID=A0ABR1VIG0_9PEZI